MPACLTHSCFAQVVKDQKGDAFAIDPCAYAWGAQGPDFFFCHRFHDFINDIICIFSGCFFIFHI